MKMIHILLCVQFCAFFLLINTFEDIERPFLFNPYTREIINWPDSPDATINGPFVGACPSDYNVEREFNTDYSMDRKALFYRMAHKEKQVQLGNIYTKCETSFQMAVAYSRGDTANTMFEFGFEVYADDKVLPEYIPVSSYQKYGPVKEARSTWEKFTDEYIRRPRHPYSKPNIHGFPNINYKFIWIRKMRTVYDVSLWNPVSMEYTLHRNFIHQLDVKCRYYDLGKDFYIGKFGYLDDFYSMSSQRNLFELVKLPDLPEKSICKKTSECVKKYDLLPAYNYQTHSSLPVSCSNLTTVPVWYEVNEDLFKNLDKFLIAMSQITEKKLIIIPGTYGTISFPKFDRKSKSLKMYLNLKYKKIPIPTIIYKIVRYQSYNCESEEELCWFNVVIAIHNQPKIPNKDRLCAQDLCEQWGWDNIQYMGPNKTGVKSKHIYCCRLDSDIKNKIKYDLGKEYNGDLNLEYFPYYEEKEDENEESIDKNKYANKKEEFENQLKELKTEM